MNEKARRTLKHYLESNAFSQFEAECLNDDIKYLNIFEVYDILHESFFPWIFSEDSQTEGEQKGKKE